MIKGQRSQADGNTGEVRGGVTVGRQTNWELSRSSTKTRREDLKENLLLFTKIREKKTGYFGWVTSLNSTLNTKGSKLMNKLFSKNKTLLLLIKSQNASSV